MPGGRTLATALLTPVALAGAILYLTRTPQTSAVGPARHAPTSGAEEEPPVPVRFSTFEKGDHVCIVGNALAERMQHVGWLDARLHARFPKHDLVIRNLGYSGDEVGGYTDKPDFNKRLRSQDFGSADQWLRGSAPVPQPNQVADKAAVNENRFLNVNTKPDVIFAFFGYNESFAGEAGLPKFKADLEAFIKHQH